MYRLFCKSDGGSAVPQSRKWRESSSTKWREKEILRSGFGASKISERDGKRAERIGFKVWGKGDTREKAENGLHLREA
jgi:hypothetical protein